MENLSLLFTGIELHTEVATTCSDISYGDMEETDLQSPEELSTNIVQHVETKTSHMPTIRSILASDKTSSRNKITQCLLTMRFIFHETFDFILLHNNIFNTSLDDFIYKKLKSKGNFFDISSEELNRDLTNKRKAVIYKMRGVLVNRKKLGGLHNAGDKNLRIFPKDVKRFITLVFRLFCLANITCAYSLLSKLCNPNRSSQTYAFSDLLEEIVDAAPTTVEMDTCKVKQFENELEIIDIVIRSLMMRLEAPDMDVAGAVARIREIQPHLATIKERPEYLKSLKALIP